MARLVAISLACAAVVAACGGGSSTSAQSDPAACKRPPRTGSFAIAVQSGGVRRTAIVHVPRGVPRTRRLPLYVVLHFAGGTGRGMERETGLSRYADRHGFIAVYPDALPRSRPFWNVTSSPSKPDDVGFARDLIDRLVASQCADADRVYATGVSNGGGEAALLGCRLADRVRAIALIAGGYSALGECNPSRPVAVLEIHGTGDTVAPYRGKPPDGRGNVPDFLARWVEVDGCGTTPVKRSLRDLHAVRLKWSGCRDGTVVEHLRLIGAGHGLPPLRAIQGKSSPVNAPAEVARFFLGL